MIPIGNWQIFRQDSLARPCRWPFPNRDRISAELSQQPTGQIGSHPALNKNTVGLLRICADPFTAPTLGAIACHLSFIIVFRRRRHVIRDGDVDADATETHSFSVGVTRACRRVS